MTLLLVATAALAAMFVGYLLRCLVGVWTFWGRKYLKQGYRLLTPRKSDDYLFDTVAIYLGLLYGFLLYRFGPSFFLDMEDWSAMLAPICVVLWFLYRSLYRGTHVFYREQGLLVSKPFQPLRSVLWDEIGEVRRRRFPRKIYDLLDKNGDRLACFVLDRKTRPFLELARRQGVTVSPEKGRG